MKKLLNYLLAAATLVLAACGGQNDPEQWTAHWENGKLPGKFSISANKQVSFSQGNLQYQASTSTWRFALHQYDFIGKNPGNTTAIDLRATQADWIDLFGWGTSGFMNQQPYSVSQELRNYGTGANSTADLTGTYYDWGRYNAITNGGDRAGLWRTLNYDEWKYILRDRPQADDLRGASDYKQHWRIYHSTGRLGDAGRIGFQTRSQQHEHQCIYVPTMVAIGASRRTLLAVCRF